MKVECEIADVEIEAESGACSRCGHEVESFGTGDASVRRSLVTLRDECPKGERNFYVADSVE